jgi:hypothetical protein
MHIQMFVCVYTYIYEYTHIQYIYIYLFIYMYIYLYICIYRYTKNHNTNRYLHTYVQTNTYICTRMHTFAYMCMCAWACTWLKARVHVIDSLPHQNPTRGENDMGNTSWRKQGITLAALAAKGLNAPPPPKIQTKTLHEVKTDPTNVYVRVGMHMA